MEVRCDIGLANEPTSNWYAPEPSPEVEAHVATPSTKTPTASLPRLSACRPTIPITSPQSMTVTSMMSRPSERWSPSMMSRSWSERHEDLINRCRRNALEVLLVYLLTIPAWPTLFLSMIGMLCGVVGVLACRTSVAPTSLGWMLAYAWLSAAMTGCLVCVFVLDVFISKVDAPKKTWRFLLLVVLSALSMLLHLYAIVLARRVLHHTRAAIRRTQRRMALSVALRVSG